VRDATLIKTGAVGAVIAAICCATPVLVLGLGVLGLSAWLGWADYIALSALAAFVLLAGYGFRRRRSSAPGACCETSSNPPGASTPAGKSS
jgi:mercuric ion transport protein